MKNHSDTAIELGELGDLNKTKEIVIRRPRAKSFHLLPVIDNIEQLNCSKLIGVLFQPNRIKTKSKFAGDGYPIILLHKLRPVLCGSLP